MDAPEPKKSSDSLGPGGTRRVSPADEKTVTATPARPPVPSAQPSQDFSGMTFGSYQLVRKVAEGGMGVVYEATQTRLARRVALKILNEQLAARPEFLHRFEREAKAAAALNHPNLVQVYDFVEVEGRHCLIMEFIDGEDVSMFVSRRGKLPLPEALDIIEQAAQALRFACGKSIIHRDIKPSNLMLTGDGRVKVADLGLAKFLTGDSDLTITHASLGSPHFMAPEQASDAGRVDHRVDIYALGITLLYLATGKRPYDGGTPYSIVMGHMSKPLPSGAELGTELPEAAEALIRNMAAKDPADRYADYDSLLADLQRVKAGFVPAVKPSRPSSPAKWIVAGAVAAAVLITAFAGWTLWGKKRAAGESRAAATVNTPEITATPPSPERRGEPSLPGPEGVGGREPWPPPDDPHRPPFEGGRPPEPGGLRLPMGPPPMRDFYTVPDGPVEVMLAKANAYAAEHKDSYGEILSAYDQVRRRASGTGYEPEIDRRINDTFQAQQKAVAETLRNYESRMHEQLRAGKPQEAFDVWKTFPSNLRSREVDNQIRTLIQKYLPPDFSPAPPGR